jgi:hypothetical protein
MKRLALTLALVFASHAAVAANASVDWIYERSEIRLDQLRDTCAASLNNGMLCWVKVARDEADALRNAKDWLETCNRHPITRCDALRDYVRQRWGF